MSDVTPSRTWTPLNARERRVLGVLIEKQKTTPDAYPMTVVGIVTGSNQKSNRDPVTQYEIEDVEDTLESLRRKGAAVLVEGSGRVPKWKHSAYEWFGLKGRPVETAILAELLLRGAQTEGELRQRASRMDEIADFPTLQTHLAYLNELGLVHFLSPPGQKRGVMVCHGVYQADEIERIRATASRELQEATNDHSGPVERSGAGALRVTTEDLVTLRQDLASLQAQFAKLVAEVEALKTALGS